MLSARIEIPLIPHPFFFLPESHILLYPRNRSAESDSVDSSNRPLKSAIKSITSFSIWFGTCSAGGMPAFAEGFSWGNGVLRGDLANILFQEEIPRLQNQHEL
jgi:hypothetical protein